ncbi:MAG: DUF1015 domain-containing protein [Oscillospiraceae bacterium]|nr:DUF1015 domain-containing protein [Oscillospiraceae bacterium]
MENNRSSACFCAADILLPNLPELSPWAVIACDQFTSQPEYWQQVEAITEGRVSTAQLILPESELGQHAAGRIERIHHTMQRFLQMNLFQTYQNAYLYTERTLQDGGVRCGIVGMVDLEAYDYTGHADSEIRATEKTVADRIPPRMSVRRGAALDLSHILLLCDDDRETLIEPLHQKLECFPKLYGFDLMLGGGHIDGWLIAGDEKLSLDRKLEEYAESQRRKNPGNLFQFAVGDGNHSLAAAKACYEELKRQHPNSDCSDHPARYALCELNNIHDPALKIAPIHRVVKHCETSSLIRDIQSAFSGSSGTPVPWCSGDESGTIMLPVGKNGLPLAILQEFLDHWLQNHPGELDYIHGEETLRKLSRASDTVGFILPAIEKKTLFPCILSNGVLPRKTFSMGEALDKRYYLEARRIE